MHRETDADSPVARPGHRHESPLTPPGAFDRIALRLLAAALVAGVLTFLIVVLWRDFTWLMALSSGAGVSVLIFFSGRAVRLLNFAWRRPPFEREE